MVSVQRSSLNATGPLCCLHVALESNENINVSNMDVKLMLEYLSDFIIEKKEGFSRRK